MLKYSKQKSKFRRRRLHVTESEQEKDQLNRVREKMNFIYVSIICDILTSFLNPCLTSALKVSVIHWHAARRVSCTKNFLATSLRFISCWSLAISVSIIFLSAHEALISLSHHCYWFFLGCASVVRTNVMDIPLAGMRIWYFQNLVCRPA